MNEQITLAMAKLLQRAFEEGAEGFSIEAIGVKNTDNKTVKEAWTQLVSGDYVAPKFAGTKENLLVITPKGQDALTLART